MLMEAGSTPDNAGQLISISGTINQNTESAAYSYDDPGRLFTSNQTSNKLSAKWRLAYDRSGNRTEMWSAVSSGTHIQSITLQQSGGAPTNQIQSVTSTLPPRVLLFLIPSRESNSSKLPCSRQLALVRIPVVKPRTVAGVK
jgi:hypothetical protein